jgi:hypothetical protein
MNSTSDTLKRQLLSLSVYAKTVDITAKNTIRAIGVNGSGHFLIQYTLAPDRVFKSIEEVETHIQSFLDSVGH